MLVFVRPNSSYVRSKLKVIGQMSDFHFSLLTMPALSLRCTMLLLHYDQAGALNAVYLGSRGYKVDIYESKEGRYRVGMSSMILSSMLQHNSCSHLII